MTILCPFFNNRPPEPSLKQTLDHGSIITWSHISFKFFGSTGEIFEFEVKKSDKVVGNLNFEQKVEVGLNSSFIDLSKLLFFFVFCTLELFVKVLFFPGMVFFGETYCVVVTPIDTFSTGLVDVAYTHFPHVV